MTTRSLLQLTPQPRPSAPTAAPLEWIVANGLGGYASGSVDGPPMRRFHGLLIAALPAPLGRALLLHALHEVVELEGTAPQALQRGRDGDPPAVGHTDFCLKAGLPQWTFRLADGVHLERIVLVAHGQNTVHVRYRLTGSAGPAHLRLRPWLDFRPHEGAVDPEQHHAFSTTRVASARCEFSRAESPLLLRMQVSGEHGSFEADPETWTQIPLSIEQERGYDHVGSAHGPGVFTLMLNPGEDAWLTATTEPWAQLDGVSPDQAWEHELTRRQRIVASSDESLQQPDTFLLPLAADQFIIRPATRVVDDAQAYAVGAEPRTVIAGYPWFTDWGRDTMISLEGLTLVTGRHSEAHDILRTFALHVRHGLIPNLFPEGQREGLYHTADATLWFFHALHRYDTITGEHALVEELLPVLRDIVHCHRVGTVFNIRVDADGLLAQGAPGVQLTWMDALVDGWVVTPRRGKPVEINALWHNALVLLASWLGRAGHTVERDEMRAEAARCRVAFNARFWNPVKKRLNDIVDGENGDDDACRPNQILAIAVPHSPLDRQYWAPVLDTVARELVTPAGLRTLSPDHTDYKRVYFGDLRSRDAAYHQGTVWPWLMGPFVDAWLAVHPEDAAGARRWVEPLLDHLVNGGCVGSVSEIFDAEAPFTPRGCCAQAWSVAELSRLVAKLAACELPVRRTTAVESA
ncbi:MAG: amylo-alpha-1,6-glucosidase [Vicinamibacteraceae bacterium]